jgi:hypothetical protein
VVLAGALTAFAGARPLMVATGVGELALAGVAYILLRPHWVEGGGATPASVHQPETRGPTRLRGEGLERSQAEPASHQ